MVFLIDDKYLYDIRFWAIVSYFHNRKADEYHMDSFIRNVNIQKFRIDIKLNEQYQ